MYILRKYIFRNIKNDSEIEKNDSLPFKSVVDIFRNTSFKRKNGTLMFLFVLLSVCQDYISQECVELLS